MAFLVSDSALDRLEWPCVVARIAQELRTPLARRRLEEAGALGRGLFEDSEGQVRERLAETSEARALLDAEAAPPLGGGDPSDSLSRLRRGGTLAPRELLELASALGVLRDCERFLRIQREGSPRLAELGAGLPDLGDLQEEIVFCIDPEGQVRDGASEALREARREARSLSAELTRRIEALLRNPEVADALSDRFYTLRNERFVLPVRADARRRVPGIVHDASASGTTIYVEPEAMVDLNNRLKQAELAAAREVQRLLRELSARAEAALPEIEAGLAILETLDHAFARGRLSQQLSGVEPEVGREGIFRLPVLRHPLIAGDEVVPNDLHLGETFTTLVLSGPNAGGKTVALKAVALCALFVRAGLHVPAAPGTRVDLMDAVLADIGDAQDLEAHLSTFSAHVSNLSAIVEAATEHSLVVLDEIGVGTDPSEGAALAQAVLEALADTRARVVTTTHYNLLKEIAAVDARFENGCVEFDPDSLTPTYRLRFGAPGISTATALAARLGLRSSVVERARTLLEGEDEQLKGLVADLARSRTEVDRERAEMRRLRVDLEAAKVDCDTRLAELRDRRRRLLRRVREEVDHELRDARAQVAAVIRDLQRGATAQHANRAREALRQVEDSLAERLREVAEPTPPESSDGSPMQAGDTVQVDGGATGTLLEPPDRRGRATVQLGSARMQVAAQRLQPVATPPTGRSPTRAPASALPDGPATPECDLRGLRVDEALEQVDAALDRALAAGRSRVRLIHGHGTGTLREAVRAHLAKAPHVRGHQPGDAGEGGNGVTLALL
ncbi:MAG: endonuclease MutS2 [Myxococcota bacterium]